VVPFLEIGWVPKVKSNNIARETVKHVFHVFDWLDVTDGTIVHWQQKLIKRQF